jgi:hypothetical protein
VRASRCIGDGLEDNVEYGMVYLCVWLCILHDNIYGVLTIYVVLCNMYESNCGHLIKKYVYSYLEYYN